MCHFLSTQWFWNWNWKQTEVILIWQSSEGELENCSPVLVPDGPPVSCGLKGFLSDGAGVLSPSCFCLGISRTGDFLKHTNRATDSTLICSHVQHVDLSNTDLTYFHPRSCIYLIYLIQDASSRGLDLLLIQCQFSLGCGLTCTLVFLHQGAPHSSLSLFLAAALSWALASASLSLWSHVARLYPLHSTERYCGKCITLLTSGHTILASLQRAVVLAFALATVASTATVYDHFLSQKDALKFWTPLTLCYTMLVVYIQGDCQSNYMGN